MFCLSEPTTALSNALSSVVPLWGASVGSGGIEGTGSAVWLEGAAVRVEVDVTTDVDVVLCEFHEQPVSAYCTVREKVRRW